MMDDLCPVNLDDLNVVEMTRAEFDAVVERTLSNSGPLPVGMADRVRRGVAGVEWVSTDWVLDVDDVHVGRCGCLIGTTRMRDGLDPVPDGIGDEDEVAQNHVGLQFVNTLSRVLDWEFAARYVSIVHVVD